MLICDQEVFLYDNLSDKLLFLKLVGDNWGSHQHKHTWTRENSKTF